MNTKHTQATLPATRDEQSTVVRLNVPVYASQRLAIDDWRYANRIPTMAEAIRRLLELGLKAGK